MKKIFKRLTVSVLSFLLLMSGVDVYATTPYEGLDNKGKALALQYSYALKKCISDIDASDGASAFPLSLSSTNLKLITEQKIGSVSKKSVRAGMNIATDDGHFDDCKNMIYGTGSVAGGGAAKFFGLDQLSKDTLWREAYGYTVTDQPPATVANPSDATRSTSNGIQEYKITATVDYSYGPEGNNPASKTVSIIIPLKESDGSLISSEDGFVQYLLSINKKKYSNPLSDKDKEKLKEHLIEYVNSRSFPSYIPISDFDILGCSEYGKKELSCQNSVDQTNPTIPVGETRLPNVRPSVNTTVQSSTISIVSNGAAIQNKYYNKPTGTKTVADYLDEYIVKNFFGRRSQDLRSSNAIAYTLFYDYLFGTGNGRCSAKAILKDGAPNNMTLDPTKNQFLKEIRMVNSTGELASYYVYWGEYKNGSFSSSVGNDDKNIGFLYEQDNDGAATCPEIAEKLGAIAAGLNAADRAQVAGYTPPAGDGTQSGGNNSGQDTTPPNCYTSAGKSIGWILCPTLEFLKDTVTNLYSQVEGFLQVKVGIFENGELNKSWQGFQSIANIIFIIFLLLVILSQLTGYGIDNYGIKKILPKLIISVILINMSFIICQLAVDVSNIVGSGSRAIFDQMAKGGSSSVFPAADTFFKNERSVLTAENQNFLNTELTTQLQPVQDSSKTAGKTVAGTLFGIASVVFVGVTYAMMAGLGGAIVAALVAFITVLAGILLVFVMLSMRQALVIIMIVTSPIAFALYIFPGTQKLFDRWKKIFTGLLLLYPICGLLVGGGNFASHLLISVGNPGFYETLVAMLIGIVPFFMIPTVLKQSMAAAGNIGTRISNLGMAGARGLQGNIKKSEAYQDYRTAQAAGKGFGSLGGLRQGIANSAIGRATGLQNHMARNRNRYIKRRAEDMKTDIMMREGGFENELLAQERARDDYSVENRATAINDITNNGARIGDSNSESGGDTLIGQYKEALANGDETQMRAIIDVAGKDKSTAKALTRFIEQDMQGNPNKYASDNGQRALRAMSKQMVDGKNSQSFSSSNPHLNNYMKDINSGQVTDQSFSDWATDAGNIHKTVTTSITTGSEISSMGGREIENMTQLVNNSGDAEATRVYKEAAASALESADKTGNYDATKIDHIAQAAGYTDFKDFQAKKQSDTIKIERERNNPFNGMSNDDVLDIATNPQSSPLESARAEQEYKNRTGGTP